mgnify:FL=1
MLCIYHIADHDGKGSAAIVRSVYPEIELLGLNHDMEIPYEQIEQHDKIVVCDISLPVDYMFKLSENKDFTWIDHHISVITEYEEKLKSAGHNPIKGLRRSGTAAIELTWEYFYPDKPVPEGVHLLAMQDIYNLSDPRVLPFEYACQSMGVNRPDEEIWRKIINSEIDVPEMVSKGQAILSWIKVRDYRLVRGMSFTSHYKGMKCICANMPQGKSAFFDSIPHINSFDFMVNFFMNKKNCWNLSFYTSKDNVDVSKIAAEFGGGGHQKAAGASSLKELPEFLKNGQYSSQNK